MRTKRRLQIRFAGRFIDLLGHQMYGGAVPAVAEFIANAWDADAKIVNVTIPEDLTVKGAEIVVEDKGEGMGYKELNEFYLNIGYERRRIRGEQTASKRLVMGRKGIGKLAGFGIAEDIILKSVKDKNLIQFNLNYSDLKSKPEIQNYSFLPDIDKGTDEENGVTVILRNLKLQRKIDVDKFRNSMSRRFALKTDKMKIFINNKELKKENLKFEFREPSENGNWAEEDIEGFGKISYWFGFLDETIKEKELRGISVFARDRIAQTTPFFFNLSGGINGQVGLEYLTGQVKAETLDNEIDYIATPRQSVNWQFKNAPIFEEWGINKIKLLCREWKKRKDKKNLDKFRHNYSEFFPRIENLPKQEKEDLILALEKISGLERIEETDFKIIAHSMISGIERESVKKIIRKINTASEESLPELYDAIKEWDIISAVSMAEVVYGKIEIINQFNKHIYKRLPEKTRDGELDMQVFIKDNPWLLGNEYEQLSPADFHHERGIDKWIKEELLIVDKEYKEKDKREGRRFDLLCIKNDWQIEILELMKPALSLDYDHVMRLNRYVTKIQSGINERGTSSKFKGKTVHGLLIADNPLSDTSVGSTLQDLRNNLTAITWNALFEGVQARYKEYLEILKMKAPEDPRLKGLIKN